MEPPVYGYSGKSLAAKLGIKPGHKIAAIQAPAGYLQWLGELPAKLQWLETLVDGADIIHLFTNSIEELESLLPALGQHIFPDGTIWISWYKKSARIPTELNEDIIRDTALALGLVDVKVCAVNDQWSGLKLVWRKELRKRPA